MIKEISDRLKKIIEVTRLSQKELAEKCSITPSNLSQILNGEVKYPRIDLFINLLNNIPKINANYLFKGEGPVILQNEEVANKLNAQILESVADKNKLIEQYEKDIRFYKEAFDRHFVDVYRKELNKYDTQPIDFERYISDSDNIIGPQDGFSSLKFSLKHEPDCKECIVDFTSMDTYNSLLKMSDDELIEFVKQRENYELVWYLMDMPSQNRESDCYSAFKTVMEKDRVCRLGFEYGILNYPYDEYWEKFKKEFNEKMVMYKKKFGTSPHARVWPGISML